MEGKIEINLILVNEYHKLEEIFYEQQLYHSKLDGPSPDRFLEIDIEKYIKYMKNKQLLVFLQLLLTINNRGCFSIIK